MKSLAILMLIAALPLCGCTSSFSTQMTAQASSARVYSALEPSGSVVRLQAKHSGLALSAAGSSGSVVSQQPVSDSNDQQFKMISLGNNVVRFVQPSSGLCMAIAGKSSAAWARLTVAKCSSTAAQQRFLMNEKSEGVFEIRSFSGAKGMCLDVSYGSMDVGAILIQYPCNNGDNERFLVTLASAPAPTPTPAPTPAATPAPTPDPSGSSGGSSGGSSSGGSTGTGSLAPDALQIVSPAQGAQVAGTVQVTGAAGSQWVNIAAYDPSQNWSKVAADVQPVNGQFQFSIDTTQMANGSHTLAIIAFSVAAGQTGGTSARVDLSLNVQNSMVVPQPTPVPTPVPTPAPTPTQTASRPAPISGSQYANFVMTFDDEFQSLNSISVGDTYNGAKWYNGTEQCCMVDSNGLPGAMFPTAVNGVSFNPYQLIPGGGLDIQLVKQNNVWYSGVLTSVDKNHQGFKQQYGYFEMMAQMPPGDGVWPAFWLLSTDPNYPGEIDIMEYYGHDQGKTFGITLHDWRSSGAQSLPGSQFPQVSGMTTGMHKYAMLWDAQMMHFYFDDQEVWSTPTPQVMNNPYYILINNGLGGYWPTDNTPAVNDFKIQYVRAYGPQ